MIVGGGQTEARATAIINYHRLLCAVWFGLKPIFRTTDGEFTSKCKRLLSCPLST